jgi:type IV pilus assembly protein PilW
MDRTIRSAGSGFAQNWSDAFGCVIDAAKANSSILPLPSALASPFANVPLRVRLAPLIIAKGQADSGGEVRGDVITVMGGTSGAGDMPQKVRTGSIAPTTLRVTNAMAFSNNDLVLLADTNVAAGCMVQQLAPASAVTADQLSFAGADYSRDNGSLVNLGNFGANTFAIQLGSAPLNPPQMLLYGVGDNHTLFSFDLLRASGADPVPVADGVVEMRALYGVDTDPIPNGIINTWIDPGDAAQGYTQAALTDGTVVAQRKLRRIIAVRIGLILRTSLRERDAIPAATTLTLFGDLPVALRQTRTLTGEDLYYRFRTVEFTVPLRNTIYAP